MMSNPIYMSMMSQNMQNNDLVARLNQLKRTINGNPMDYIQNMLKNGQVTQQQYNQAVQKAQQLQQMIGRI